MPARRIGRQLRLVPALLVPTTRAVGWGPPLAAFALSLGLLALAVRPGLALSPEELVRWLRLATIVAALGCAFVLDDPSEPTTESVAGSLLLRRTLRVALLLPAAAAWWVAALWRVRAVHPGLPLPVAALTLEAAALLAVTAGARRRRVAPGARAARWGGGRSRPARPGQSPPPCCQPGSRCTPSRQSAPGTPPTGAGPCCSASPWRPSPPPAATPPTAASPASSAGSLTGAPAAARHGPKARRSGSPDAAGRVERSVG